MRRIDRCNLAVALAAVLLAALSGCAATATGKATHSAAASSVAATSPVTVSATAVTGSPAASASIGAGTPRPSGSCLASAAVRYPGSDNPLRAVCVRVGGTITLTLTVTGAYRWSAPVSSNPAVAAVGAAHTDSDGTLHATVTMLRPGEATISSTDTFVPDPHGPPTRLWTLTVTVES